MLFARFSLKTLMCLVALFCLAPGGLFAQEEKSDEKKTDQPAAEEEKSGEDEKAEEEKKPADEEKSGEDEKAEEEKKPAAEEKSGEDEKAEEEKKPADEKKSGDDEKAAEEPKLELKEMVINLDNPSGLAIHEKTGHVFIASNDGVHRFIPGELPLKCPLEISDFPTDVYGKGPKYNISALGVAFLDNERLVVGDGSLPDGEELVRVYKVPEEHSGKYQKADEAEFTVGPIPKDSEHSKSGEGNYYGVAVLDGTVYVTNNGDDTKGWISKFSVKDGKPTELEPFIATKVATQVDAPVPIAARDGKLYVGQMGEVSVPGDSLLTVYDPKTYNPDEPKAEKSWKIEIEGSDTGLSDIAGLAYSEQTKKWYCTDFAWAKPEDGGLFELTVDDDKVTAKKLAKLDKPTALAFDDSGNLYVAVFGSGEEGDAMTPGKLLMVDADQLKSGSDE